jgi:hypothetical protein
VFILCCVGSGPRYELITCSGESYNVCVSNCAVASCKGEAGLGKNSVASLQLTELNFFSCDRTLIELLVNIFSLKLPF